MDDFLTSNSFIFRYLELPELEVLLVTHRIKLMKNNPNI